MAKQYREAPAMQIDPSKHYTALMHTEKGDIEIELFAREAPITVNNFVFLAREGFYNNTTFHRVISGFMAQGVIPKAPGAEAPAIASMTSAARWLSNTTGPVYSLWPMLAPIPMVHNSSLPMAQRRI